MTDNHKPNDVNKISRRDFLKTGLASAVALVLGGLTRKDALAAQTWYGLDTNSEICCSMPINFYIGKGGEENLSSDIYFNYESANAVGYYNTHTYWVLHGPDESPEKTAAGYYAYGQAQAESYVMAWYSLAEWAPYAGGKTLFADIEPYYDSDGSILSYNGWQHDGASTSKFNNRQILNGFLDYIANYQTGGVNAGFKPGIYTTPALFRPWFGPAYRTSQAAVLWVSGCRTNSSTICRPCSNNCSTTQTDVTAALPTIKKTTLGGNKAIIWQYWIDCVNDDCDCATQGDWNASSQYGYVNFTPSRVASTAIQYVLSC